MYKFPDGLTKKERDIASLIMQGKTIKEMMELLSLTEGGVKKRIGNVLRKALCDNQKKFIVKYQELVNS